MEFKDLVTERQQGKIKTFEITRAVYHAKALSKEQNGICPVVMNYFVSVCSFLEQHTVFEHCYDFQLIKAHYTIERELCVLQHEIHNKQVFPGPQAATLIHLAQLTEKERNYMPDTVLGTLCAEKTCEEGNYD